MPVSKPYKCPYCDLSFSRSEHLNRHTPLHTNEKRYQCPCGKTFIRSDVLAQHLLRCDASPNSPTRLPLITPSNRSRTKKACDRCARGKLKCNFQEPCGRCSHQQTLCQYTRQKPNDLYQCYRIHGNESSSREIESSGDSLPQLVRPAIHSQPQAEPWESSWNQGNLDVQLQSLPMDSALQSASSPSLLLPLDAMEPFFGLQLFPSSPIQLAADNSQQTGHTQNYFSDSFSSGEKEAIEAKGGEMRNLLSEKALTMIDKKITAYITPENLLLFFQRFRQQYRRTWVFLHDLSFELTRCPPILSLAIMVVGGCYSPDRIPIEDVVSLAILVMRLIENQPHEIQMDTPPLSTIQASAMICSILVRSRTDIATKYVFKCFARNISMIQRTTVFTIQDSLNYNGLALNSFNWQLWIDQESLRRTACVIFCQDMVGCIFQGVLPTLCPFDFDVALPCYESCWEATTAFDCLQHLRARPQPISISNAIRQIWVPSIPNKPLFEASEFGMFVMICAIHSLLFQATKTDIGCEFPSSDAAFDDLLSTMEDGANLDSLLRRDFSGPSVVALADRIISTGGCPTLKKINGALDSWLAIWKLRLYREPFYEGSATIFDPLPFFWLAKLYTLLHHSEFLMGEDSEFGVSRVDFADTGSKLGVQSKIIRWLSKLTNAKCRLEIHVSELTPLS